MVIEQQALYPKGTYKVAFARLNGSIEYSMVNLCTGSQCRSWSVWDMIKSIESDLSANRYPQSALKYRSWCPDIAAVGNCMPNELLSLSSVKKETLPALLSPTFILKVLFRQNATWQGTIQWIEGRQTRQYRSLNELLKLMDEALALSSAMQGDRKN